MTLFRSWFPSKSVDSSLEARVTRAFSDGYLLAMQEGMKQLSESIRNAAIEESLTRLEPMIAERATALGNVRARETQELLDGSEPPAFALEAPLPCSTHRRTPSAASGMRPGWPAMSVPSS